MRLVSPVILSLVLTAAAACDSGKAGTTKAAPPSPAASSSAPAGTAQGEPVTDRIAYAKQLLAEAGYPGGKGFPKLEILYNKDEGHQRIAAALQEMWRTNLGINVELRQSEWKVYLDDQSKMRFQMVRRGWIADYRDPNTFIDMFTSWSGNNNTNWKSAEYDDLVRAAEREGDVAKRYAILQKAEKILLTELPILPLYYYVSSNAWPDTLKGVYPNVLDVHYLNEAYLEGKEMLTINNATEIQSLDPAIARGVPEHRILLTLLEGLTVNDPKTCEARPGMAERWERSPDGLKWTFHLRESKWTDGKPVTAGDFAYSWCRVLDPATPTDYAHQLYALKGAEAFNQGKTKDASTVGVRAVDDRTLEVELAYPCTYFLDLCNHFTYFPVRKDVIEKHGTDWTKPGKFVGNGPFRLKEWAPTDHLTVEKNPDYWNAKVVRQPLIRFLPIDNRMTQWNLYKEGTCDWVTVLPLEQIAEIVKRPDYRGDTYMGTYFYGFNCDVPGLKDRRVRKALALAVDRDIITGKITRQGQKPAYGYVPPIFPGYQSPRYDVKD